MAESALFRRTLYSLIAITLTLALLHILSHMLPLDTRHQFLVRLFDMDAERNIPTWFSATVLFVISTICARLYMSEPKTSRLRTVWLVVGALFLLGSVDEVATIHEEVGSYLDSYVADQPVSKRSQGLISFIQNLQFAPNSPWILYYSPVLIAIFGGLSLAFNKVFRGYALYLRLSIVAIACYLGAIALDFVQGLPTESFDKLMSPLQPHLALQISVVCEETLELLASSLILCSLLGYLLERRGAAVNSVVEDNQPKPSA